MPFKEMICVYDLSGLKHLIYFSDLPMFILAMIILVFSYKEIKTAFKKKRWNEETKKTIFIIIFASLWFIIPGSINAWHILNPSISSYDGEYLREYRANEVTLSFFSFRYVFDDGTEPQEAFYLDSFSKKKIYNKDFEEGKRYRIYYEEKDKIIVRVEEIE